MCEKNVKKRIIFKEPEGEDERRVKRVVGIVFFSAYVCNDMYLYYSGPADARIPTLPILDHVGRYIVVTYLLYILLSYLLIPLV